MHLKRKRRKWLIFAEPCSNYQVTGLLFGFKNAPGDFVPLWNKQETARQIKTNAKKPNTRPRVPAVHQSPPLSFMW